jgi:hypothetical protein
MHAYAGTASQPFPPLSGGHWLMMTDTHKAVVERVPAMLGGLPVWHYHDEQTVEGGPTVRYFAFRTATGRKEISALGFLAYSKDVPRTLGDPGGDADGGTDDGTGDGTDPNSGDDGSGGTGTGDGGDPASECQDGYVWDGNSCVASATDVNQCPSGQQPIDPTNPAAGCTPISGGSVAGPSTGGSGQTTGEPIPQSSASCTWTPDATNAEVVGVAVNISYNNQPAAWADQSIFQYKASDGSLWSLAMYWQGGKKMVSAFRCVPTGNGTPGSPTAATASSSSTGLYIAIGLLALGGLLIAGFAAGSPVG